MSGGYFDEVHLRVARALRLMYYNAMKKTLSALKEALTRARDTTNATRDAANVLSSALNYFATSNNSLRIFRRCKKPL